MINWVSECGQSTPSSKLMATEHTEPIIHDEIIQPEPSYVSCKKRLLPIVKCIISVAAHLGFAVSVAIVIWCLISSKQGVPQDRTFYIVFSLLAALFYIVILVEAASSDVYKTLRSYSDKLTAEDYIDRVKEARPQVRWVADCYHYEYGNEMNAESEQKQPSKIGWKKQRIITGHDKETFQFSRWRDYTRDIKGLLSKPVIRFECSKVFIFKDESSKSQYMQQYQGFRERVRRRDEFMEHDEELTIPGYHHQLTACVKLSDKPCWLADSIFWLCTMLLLTWPYRLAFKKLSCKVYIVFVKQLEVSTNV